jgi:hypothetical protein
VRDCRDVGAVIIVFLFLPNERDKQFTHSYQASLTEFYVGFCSVLIGP